MVTIVVGVHAGGAGVEPDEEGAQLAVHSRVVLELDYLAVVLGWFDAFSKVGDRRVDPARNLLLPHVDQLLIQEHRAVQQVSKTLQQLPGLRQPVGLVSICKCKPDLELHKSEVRVLGLDPPDESVDSHSRLAQHLCHCWALVGHLLLALVRVPPLGGAPAYNAPVGLLCHLVSQPLRGACVVCAALQGAVRPHAAGPGLYEVPRIGGGVEAGDGAEDEQQPTGDDHIAEGESQGKDGKVGHGVREGHGT